MGDTLQNVGAPIKATAYFPIFSGIPDRTTNATLVVHTSGDSLSLSVSLQKQIAAVDPTLAVHEVLTMPQIVGQAIASQSATQPATQFLS